MQANPYFPLIVPVCSALMGLGLVGCWLALRQYRYLLWLAAAYILPSVPLAAQSLMNNAQLAETSVVMGAFYLLGFWSMARGMAWRYGGAAHPRLAWLISLLALACLYYFSRITDQLPWRILTLNVAMATLLLLGVGAVYRSGRAGDWMERVLRLSYLTFVAFSLARPLIVSVLLWAEPLPSLTRSPLWLLMLAVTLLLSLWFLGVLLAVHVRELFITLQRERDRDPLTQLLNRRAFFEQASRRLAQPDGGTWAVLVCDVDHFKQINDTHGHAKGDEVLTQVAQMLLTQVRQDDLVVRFGGEEFVVMLRCPDLAGAIAVADRMRTQLAQLPCAASGCAVTASFGVTLIEDAQGLTQAIDRADARLYEAKRTGRNRVVSDLNRGEQNLLRA